MRITDVIRPECSCSGISVGSNLRQIRSYEQVASILGLSAGVVRDIENRALRKLAHNLEVHKIYKEYFGNAPRQT